MKEKQKRAVNLAVGILKEILIDSRLSIAFSNEEEALIFFDTETYLATKKMDGVQVKLIDLVRR